MAEVPIQISGMLYDLLNKTTQRVVLMGNASIIGLSVGGGPIIPPDTVPPGGGGGVPPHPEHPIWGPPGMELPPGSGFPPVAGHPLPVPPTPPLPPEVTPPSPGDPTKPVPPPAGSAGWPVQPMVPPPYVVVNYPGIGPVIVAPPATAAPK